MHPAFRCRCCSCFGLRRALNSLSLSSVVCCPASVSIASIFLDHQTFVIFFSCDGPITQDTLPAHPGVIASFARLHGCHPPRDSRSFPFPRLQTSPLLTRARPRVGVYLSTEQSLPCGVQVSSGCIRSFFSWKEGKLLKRSNVRQQISREKSDFFAPFSS